MIDLRPRLVDTHAHLADDRYRGKLGEVLRDSALAGVAQVIAVATTAEDSGLVVEIASQHPGVFASVGIHPNHASEALAGDWERVEELARRSEVVAVGETGLDRHWARTPFELQQDYFGRHLELAHHLDLPVIIHCRDCHRDIVEQLSSLNRPAMGVLHSFTGTWPEAQELLSLGLHISFAGMITFANRTLDPLREAAAQVPIDRILVETDSPYLSPHPKRGRDNEPSRVTLTASKVAEVRGISLDRLAEATTSNAQRLFRMPIEAILSSNSEISY